MNTSTRPTLTLLLVLVALLLSANAIGQDRPQSKTAIQGRQSLVEKYKDYLVPENIVFQAADGSAQHYRINETTVLAIIKASSTDPASASGRLYRSSSTATPTSYTGFLKVQAGATGCANYGWRAWAKYPLSSLSCAQSINDVNQNIWCFNEYHVLLDLLEFDTRRVTIDPATASALTLWNAIGSGTLYDDEENADGPTGGTCSNATKNSYDFPGAQDIYNAIASPGWFALGYLVCNNDNASYYAEFCGATDLNPPSLVISYTPKSVPSTPSLSSPANGATCVSLTVTFDWSDVTNADTYRLQIDDDPGFGSPLYRDVTSSQYVAQSGELSAATSYYWRIRASNCAGNSPYSSYRGITTSEQTPNTPTLGSPSNGATCVSLPITFSWNSVSYAVSYRLLISLNSNLSPPVIDQPNLTSTSYTVSSGLQNGVRYYWGVFARNNCGIYGNANVREFTTTVNAPSAPTANPATNITTNSFTANWNSVSGATGYRVDVSTSSIFSSYVPGFQNADAGNVTSGSVTGLREGTTYYYQVRAYNSCDSSANSNTISVTTAVQLLDAVTITSGPTGSPNPVASGSQVNCTVSASDSRGHGLSYSWSATGGSVSNPNTQNPSWTAPQNTTDQTQNYTISVTVTCTGGQSKQGSYQQGVSPVTDAVTITSGPSGSPNPVSRLTEDRLPNKVNCSVTATDSRGHALNYSWSATSGSFSNTNVQNPIWSLDSSNHVSPNYSSITVTVSCTDGSSQTKSFQQITSVEKLHGEIIPAEFTLLQNYPNPFNPMTTIEFSIPNYTFVSVVIFNSLGIEIEVLLDQYLPPGHYRIQWTANDNPSGVYFYRLRSSEFNETKKLLLLR